MKNKLLKLLLLITSIFFLCHSNTYAASKSMTVYSILKDGNTVYCGCFGAIFKLNLKNGKAKKLATDDPEGVLFGHLKKKGNWLYFTKSGPTWTLLCRVNTSGGKTKKIVSKLVKDGETYVEDVCFNRYVISGSKIYYNTGYNSKSGNYNMVMKLNGKEKKKSKVKTKMKEKYSNIKGYKIIDKSTDSGYSYYLKTPKKKYFLGKINY